MRFNCHSRDLLYSCERGILVKGEYIFEDMTSEYIRLKRFKEIKSIDWKNIKAVYKRTSGNCQDIRYLTLTNVDEECYNFLIRQKDPQHIAENITDIFQSKLKEMGMQAENIEFSYAENWLKRRKKMLRILPITLALLLLISAFRFFQVGFLISDPTFPIIGLLLITGVFYVFKLTKEKIAISIRVSSESLKVENEHHKTEIRNIDNFLKYRLDRFSGFIEFRDGLCLRDLDKLYYWPLLREYLQVKLKG